MKFFVLLNLFDLFQECHHIVTSADNGEMFSWDTIDGRCIESKRLGHIHTSVQPYRQVLLFELR